MKHISKCWGMSIVRLAIVALFVAVPFTAVQADVVDFDSLSPPFNTLTPIPDGYGSTAAVTVTYQTLYSNSSPEFNYAFYYGLGPAGGYANLN